MSRVMTEKPLYRVPSMAEIAALPKNGLKVISTFSGCGGSSLGYRMAGCSVLAASEFVPAAVETYKLNCDPSTIVWTTDIREMTGGQMLADVGLAVGELDILDGSPPCAAFSLAGKRSEGWGKVSKYSDTEQRSDDLFYEFARILREMQPKAFVAENVAGLVRGVAKGYFKRIHQALRDAGYIVAAAVLDASWLGVPQARQRVIFIGMRNDLGLTPQHPTPLPYQFSLSDAVDESVAAVARRNFGGVALAMSEPLYTVTTQSDDFWCIGSDTPKDPETNARLVRDWSESTREKILGALFDPETMKDIDIRRFAIGPEWDKLKQGESSGKYFQLVRTSAARPSPTITASGGQVGIAGPTHFVEPRKFTLGELRRICSFPDDFQLTGTYEQRWERLGRAVPPVMMKHIATSVATTLGVVNL